MLSHLVYVSNRKSICTEQEIEKILVSCQKNNATRNITGVLLYSNSHFIQYLEGPYNEIIGLYDKIKKDSRHANPILISSSPIKERRFPSWQMGAKRVESKNIEFKTVINYSEKETFDAILAGKKQDGNKAIPLIQKFFK